MDQLPLRWLYIDFNSYFASVEQQLNPSLRNLPVVVIPVDSDYTSVIAASQEAKLRGIKTGTKVKEAKNICPDIICVVANHHKYVSFHNLILKEIDRHIPVQEVKSIDEMACMLMDNENSIAQASGIALNIKKGIAANIGPWVKCSIGIAPNCYLAKVATELQKPDGLVILRAEEVQARLNDIKLRDLPGIGSGIALRLAKNNIYDFTSLWKLSGKELRSIWGTVWGEKMWLMIRGIDLPTEQTQRSSFSHSHILGGEMRNPLKAKYIAMRMVLKITSRLRNFKYYSKAIILGIRFEDGDKFYEERHCYRAQDSFTFLSLLKEMWDSIVIPATKKIKGRKIKKISLVLHELEELHCGQETLFSQIDQNALEQTLKNEKLSYALDSINKRFGLDSVMVGMLPQEAKAFTGTKIAFNRIPNSEEFDG